MINLMKKIILGKTTQGRDIAALVFGSDVSKTILIIGGVHGDELEGVIASQNIIKACDASQFDTRIIVIPVFNIDGYIAHTRKNARGVDLNRNLPTKDWTSKETNARYSPGSSPGSEVENQSLIQFIDDVRPVTIVSLHSYMEPMLNINGNCESLAIKISETTGYPIKKDIGYPTPGCLGTYYGLERDIPVMTYEFLRGMDEQDIIDIHVPAIVTAITG